MTTRTTYNLLRRGITALALVCISVITFAQEPEPTPNVAKIGETEYATLQAAIDAAENGQTVELIADISETVANTGNANNFTIDLGEHTWTYTQTENDFAALKQDNTNSVIALKNGTMVVSGTEGFNVWARNGKVIIESGTYTISSHEDYNIYATTGYVEIYGGTFTNSDTEPYNHNASLKSLNLNVHNSLSTVEHIKVFGGTFTADPSKGDDSAWGTSTFVASGYIVKTHETTPQTTYTVEPEVKVEVNLTDATQVQTAAANALAGNTSVSETTGLGDNGSLDVSITGVNLDANNNVTSATFEVTPKDANGNVITEFSGTYTFRLPISAGVEADKWVNLKHDRTYIRASQVKKEVVAEVVNKYVTVTTTSFSPFSYDVLENPVAKIGERLYETMEAAIAAVPDATETTIELIADVTEESITIPAAKNINLVGGAHTVSGTITSSGTLTIVSGKYTNTTENALKTEGSGTIIINAGVFSKEPADTMIADEHEVMVGESNTYVVAVTGTAEAKIVTTVGEVETTTLYQTVELAITAAGTEATTITLLKNVAADVITIPEDANITLVLGEVTLTKAITNNGTLNISGGTISGAITNNNALTFTSGTISGNITNAESATMTIAAGTFTGTITNNAAKANLTINGGTFTSKPVGNNYTCASDHELIYNGTNYVYDAISAAEAKIGADSYYYTIAKAIEVADATITLLKNPTSTETIEIPEGKNITLQIKDGVTLTKVIANSGTLQITSGTTSGAIKIMTADATVTIASGVTHPAVQLDEALSAYVLKAISGTSIITYKAVKKYSIQVGSDITSDPQLAAANALAGNDQLTIRLDGLEVNQSIAVTILSVTLDANNNVTSATFNVVLSGADDQPITTASNDITFRLPVSVGIDAGKWVNISNATEAIPGATVQTGKYIEITTKVFSNNSPNFTYTILATQPVAQIGETKYETVGAAITAATTAQTIEILKAIDEAITVAAGKTITLAGGGFELSGAITNSGALTLTSGTYSGAIASNGGTITINGGSFSSSLTTNGGAITIKGGTFASTCTFIETTDGIAISGGTFFDNIPAVGVCADGYVPVKIGEGKFNMTNAWTMTDETAITSIDYYGSAGYTVATATYTRSVGMVGVGGNPAGTKYGTICLPFNITAKPAGVKALYKATGVTDSELTITEVTDFSPAIPAGTPLIFELSAVDKTMTIASTNATINTADITAPSDGNLLRGTYTEQNYTTELTSKYYLNGDAFHQAVNSLKVPAYRAYIEYTTSDPAPERLNIVKASDPIVTPLENATAEVSIVAVYDLQGRNIGRLQSGINIVRLSNGQTVKIIKM